MSETPVWQVGSWDLEADLDKVVQQWDYVREVLEDPQLYELRNSDVSGWSCGEHAGHIAMVTHWVAAGIEQNLLEPQRDVDGEWTEPTAAILEQGDFPRGAAQSPPEVDPAGRPREDFVPVLPVAEAAWLEVGAKLGQLPSCPARFHHFALGYLTSTEWVRFCALHTAHHLAVVRDIRAGAA
jgi:hypothetical protein